MFELASFRIAIRRYSSDVIDTLPLHQHRIRPFCCSLLISMDPVIPHVTHLSETLLWIVFLFCSHSSLVCSRTIFLAVANSTQYFHPACVRYRMASCLTGYSPTPRKSLISACPWQSTQSTEAASCARTTPSFTRTRAIAARRSTGSCASRRAPRRRASRTRARGGRTARTKTSTSSTSRATTPWTRATARWACAPTCTRRTPTRAASTRRARRSP